MAHDVDLCVIGTGPGGYIAAVRAAQLGLKTAVVEREEIGGICLNRGCIPTKAMLRSAEVMQTMQHSADYGILADNVRLDFAKVIDRRDKVVKQLTGGVGSLFKSYGIQVVRGSGRLAERGKVVVSGEADETLNARNVIIATGSVPAKLPIPGADNPNVIDSDGALALTEVPGSLLVIGGGAVGSEWANVFAAFGSKVTLVEMLPTLLPLEDEEMGRTLQRTFQRQGITVHTEAKLDAIETADDGKAVGVLTLKDGKQERVTADKILVGVGRKPNTTGLGLEDVDVKVDRRGFVEVDDYLQTSLPNVYAIGDVTGKQLLAHLASHQGVTAVENIAGHEVVMDYKVVPACTYTHPEVASVGLSEKKAREQGYDVKIGKFPFAANGRALSHGETEGMVKIVADAKYGELLGVHIIGPQASELIPEAALGIKLEATLEDIQATIHAHPTLAEAVMEAAWAAAGGALNLPKPRERAQAST
ncbi:MAG: dihydrolipoyl dehydrogenase [Chloroflexota bacterium]|nr:dihydrolipoyl dehydrogenase [Chloroflexota bacterium]